MTFPAKAALGSFAVLALMLSGCAKETRLASDGSEPASGYAVVTPAPAAPADTAVTADSTTQTIAGVAAAQNRFSTLLAAAKAAGLYGDLAAPGPITVFAPTNAAFAALPPGKLDDLMKPENKNRLEALLKHHIVAGKVTSIDLQGTSTEATLNGTLPIDSSNADRIRVADANIIGPDITASNGVIHPVDKVLFPAT